MKDASLILAFVLVAGLAVPASARTMIDRRVPFKFMVGSATLAAGHYQIQPSTSPGEDVLIVTSVDTGKRTVVEYITRIAARGRRGSPRWEWSRRVSARRSSS